MLSDGPVPGENLAPSLHQTMMAGEINGRGAGLMVLCVEILELVLMVSHPIVDGSGVFFIVTNMIFGSSLSPESPGGLRRPRRRRSLST